MKSIARTLLWPLALGAIVLGVNDNAPYLVALRGSGNGVLLAFGIAVPIVLMRAGAWADGKAARLLLVLWLLPAPCLIGAQLVFQLHKRHTLGAEDAAVRLLGRHFVVGYTSADEAGLLAERGLIAGLYVTRHNVARRTLAEVKAEIGRAAGAPARRGPCAPHCRGRPGRRHRHASVAAACTTGGAVDARKACPRHSQI